MPELDANDLDVFRTYPQTVKRYLAYMPQVEIFSGQVDGDVLQDSVTNGIYAFDYDNEDGDFNDVERHMTIEFGSTPGARDIGVSRIRKLATASRIFIAETSPGDLPITDNAYFSIKLDWRPWPKKPRLVGTKNNAGLVTNFVEYHDYETQYSDQNDVIEPIANITRSATSRVQPDPAGFVDPGQIYRTLSMSSYFSWPVANATTIASRVWDVGDGTITVGTSTSETITVQFPVGARWIKLTITDSNGNNKNHYFPVLVFDDENQPLREMLPGDELGFKVTSDSRIDGRSMSFEIFGQDDTLEAYTGQLTIYWEKAKFGIYDPPDDYIVSFMGWAIKDAETLKMHNRTRYTVEVGGIQFWLSSFNSFGQKLSEKAVVNRWYKFPANTLSVDRVAHYILREYSTAMILTNLYFSPYQHTTKAEDFKKDKIWSQLVELQKGNLQVQVCCDSMGTIWFTPKYEYLELSGDDYANRIDRDIVINMDKADWTDSQGLILDYDYVGKVSITDSAGSKIKNGKNVLVYAKAPGFVPADSGADEELPFQRLPPEANNRKIRWLVGQHHAQADNPRGNVSLTLIGNYDFIEPAWGEPVTITWIEESLRGTIVNTEEFILTGIQVTHSNDIGTAPKKITWTLKQATIGLLGAVYTPEKSVQGNVPVPTYKFPKINIPYFNPPEWINLPPSVPGLGLVTMGWGTLTDWFQHEYLMISRNANDNDPNYEQINLALVGGTVAFAADPWSPLYLNAGTQVNAWAATHDSIYRILDIFGARTKTLQQNLSAFEFQSPLPFFVTMVTQPSSVGFCAVAGYSSGGSEAIKVWYTINGGTTWNMVEISSPDPSVTDPVKLYASPFIDGKLYLSFVDNTETISHRLWRSLDFGATWEDLTDLGLVPANFAGMYALPASANPNSDTIIYQVDQDSIRRYNIVSEISVSINLPAHAVFQSIIDIAVSPLNPNRMVLIIEGSGLTSVYVSRNAGVTWTQTIGYGTSPRRIVMNAKNVDSFYLMGEDDNIDFVAPVADLYYTRNFGLTYESKTGDILTYLDPTPLYIIGWAGTL